MSKRKRQRRNDGPWVGIPKAIMATPAWRAMSPGGRLLWIELRGWLRNDRLNNGKVHLSCRAAAKAIGVNKETISVYFIENEHYGFLRKTAEGFLGSDGRGIAAKYLFTDIAHGTHPPTRDYEKWTGEMFVYTPRRPARKKQNPVRKIRTLRTENPDIRKAGNGGAVCPENPDIGKTPMRTENPDISRLPSPALGEEQDQGSSTVRAPALAGGAGSSPAPDVRPELVWSTPTLTEMTDPVETPMTRRGASGRDTK